MKLTNIKVKSIKFKMLSSFLLIVSIIIFLIWILEILLFEPIYKGIQIHEVERVNEAVITGFSKYLIDDYIDISMKNNCNIIIFKLNNDSHEVLYNTSRVNIPFQLEHNINSFLDNIGDSHQITYIDRMRENEIVNVGNMVNINGEDIYFYVTSLITPVNNAIRVFIILLLIISITSLLITIVVSIWLSRRISKPLLKLSASAKQLSEGNLDVKFDAKGYEESENLADTLNYAIVEIKKSEVLQKEVLQNVSHELKTPLTIIQSYAELIQDFGGENAEKRYKHTNIIIDETKKLEYLINDMIDLSKLQAHTLEYNFTTFNLVEVIEKFEEFYKTKYNDFLFTFSYPKECVISADRKRIEQVLSNLINNAINYSQGDTKKINVVLKKVYNEDKYRLSIQDFGIGISEDDKKHIFDRHFRAFSSKRAVVGSGIGLTIVKEILEYHRYTFSVDSVINKGSTFYIDFNTVKK